MAEEEGMEYELVPISPLHKIKREIEEIKKMKQGLPIEDMNESIKNLVIYLDKSGKSNQELISKITELMIRVTELTSRVNDLVESIGGQPIQPTQMTVQRREAPVAEETPAEKASGIKSLVEQNVELTNTLKSLEGQLKKESIRDALKRALEKSVSK